MEQQQAPDRAARWTNGVEGDVTTGWAWHLMTKRRRGLKGAVAPAVGGLAIRALAAVALYSAWLTGPALAQSLPQPFGIGASGQPVPRYASLKSDRVQVRQGPGTDHKILWVFSRVGLPVEVIQEFENWRQIRDQDGSVGWVAHALLSARRTAIVLAWNDKGKPVPLHDEESTSARTVALLESGVICGIRQCDGRWCHVSVGDYRGYIEQTKLWGVYPGEKVK